jgi:glycosyltransferase involved in cell wall biosynthesis
MADLSPFFSVVIPVFNRARILPGAIDSVLAQSDQDFEIIVVDDGSSDNPAAVVEDFGDPRIQYVRKENGGGSSARNRGIDLARGRFIAFLDSDDVFLPHHLAAMRRIVEGERNIAGYARMIVERGRGRAFLKPPRAIAPGEHMAHYLLCDRGFIPTITLVVAAETAKRVRYNESLPFAQDTDFAIRLFLAGNRFVMAEEPGAVWRDLPDPGRASAGRKGWRLRNWLEDLKPRIPKKAYYGGRGWMIAKGLAPFNKSKALRLYLTALRHGCYSPRTALVIFLQIFMPDRFYRSLADGIVALFRGRVWSRAEAGE